MGTEESNINNKAGTAALAKKASEVADQTEVARVLNPIGLSSKVAGSSFMVVRKTRPAPAMMPGLTRGKVTESNVCIGERPSMRAAASKLVLT